MHNSFLAFLCLCFCTVLKGQALYGTSGLLHMPTADMQKDKTVMLGGNVLDKHPLSTYWNNKNYTYTYNYYINVTIFPWLEVAYTCTLVKGVKGNYWPEQTWGKFRNQDRNFSGRLRLWKEGWWKEWTPQLVLGANDPGSFDNNGGGNINFNQEAGTHNYFNRFFLAATKHLYFQNVAIQTIGSCLYHPSMQQWQETKIRWFRNEYTRYIVRENKARQSRTSRHYQSLKRHRLYKLHYLPYILILPVSSEAPVYF